MAYSISGLTLLMSRGGLTLLSNRLFVTTRHLWVCSVSKTRERRTPVQKRIDAETLSSLFFSYCFIICIVIRIKQIFLVLSTICFGHTEMRVLLTSIIPISYWCLGLLPNLPDLPQINLSAVIKTNLILSPTFTLTYTHKVQGTHTHNSGVNLSCRSFLSLMDF